MLIRPAWDIASAHPEHPVWQLLPYLPPYWAGSSCSVYPQGLPKTEHGTEQVLNKPLADDTGLLEGPRHEVTHVTSTHIPLAKARHTLLVALSAPRTLPGQTRLCYTHPHGDWQMDQ